MLVYYDVNDNENSKRRKKIIVLIFFIIILFFLLFLVSYGFFEFVGKKPINNNTINTGTVIFSYQEKTNGINLTNTLPMSDESGKMIDGENYVFEFLIIFKMNVSTNVSYEINLTPSANNTLSSKYVKVYLEDVTGELFSEVPTFDKLLPSKLRDGAFVLYTKKITTTNVDKYKLKVWVSNEYPVDEKSREFKFFVNVNGYIN